MPAHDQIVPAPSRRGRILVVDDEAGARYGLSGALRDAGFEVDVAEDGAQALEVCDRWTPNLVLTDLDMPTMRGETLIANLRERHPEIQIAVISGNAELDAGRHAVALGVPTWFSKPLQLDAILSRVEQLLDHRD